MDEVIPDKFQDDNIILEMHTIRIIGNAYTHRNDNFDRDANKDRYTCYVAMKTIARWLIECKQLYPEYLRKEEARRVERKKKNKRIYTSIFLAGLGIVATALGINKIGKK